MNKSSIPTAKVRFGPFEVDLQQCELRKFGIRIRLRRQPFKLLATLLEHPGELVTRPVLQRRIWGEETVVDFDHGLGTALNKLREALGDSSAHPLYIETVPCLGYRFIAPVHTIEPINSSTIALDIPANHHHNGTTTLAVASPRAPVHARKISDKGKSPFFHISAGCAAIASIVLVWLWTNRATSLPPIRYSPITSSGRVYQSDNNLERRFGIGTDGIRIYFSEIRDGRVVLASSSISGGDSLAISVPSEVARPVLADVSPDGSKLLVRSLPVQEMEGPFWVVPSSGGSASMVPGVLGHAASWLPDGDGIIYASGHDLMIVARAGRTPLKLASVPGRAFAIRYKPDRSRLRFTVLDSSAHTSSLWELSADGKRLRRLLPEWHNPSAECCGTWTADGSHYIFHSTQNGNSDLWELQEKSGLFPRKTDPIQITAGPLSYQLSVPSTDGSRIFTIGAQISSRLLMLEPTSGRSMPWFADINVRHFAFAPNGQFMAWTSASDGLLWRSKLDGSQRLRLTSPPAQTFRAAWSPDSSRLVFDSREPGRRNKIYIVPAKGGAPEALLNEDTNEADPSWSPDGNSIVFGRLPDYLGEEVSDKAIYLVDVRSKKVSLLPGSTGLFSPRWSPDGRYIAAMPLNQTRLMLFDRLSARWSGVEVPEVATSPTWSADSRFVYFKTVRTNNVSRIYIPTKGQRHVEMINRVENVQPADSFNFVGLTPDNLPLILTRFSSADVYALEPRRETK
jgi:Tol biopolymer transport system component/DNA-binding winged helix-turn-helix (wHTH) protein